ncbi:hypothetical protein SAMN04488021_10621 [Paracoccus aminovorans]|uniref:Uncharacterized protein n=1 Tax=Paracoccus aminovorans TaxID=34004 RepID=A0A1I2YWL5_9RHOB|nr:hypothetical protein [Paracoccus aminovorans]CQR85785.1 hypothetical protein JCM7685_1209 [Paracoccus aminovorans]SFH29536.1 hypothetical protein SAMN04488021_10621 [Paracoccus aminovorans]
MRLPILLIALAAATPALASSDEAWEQFRADVEKACTALAPAEGETAIEINPFGSENYGAALLITTLADGGADRYVCIYDKKAKTAELTAAFEQPKDVSMPAVTSDGNVVPEETTKTDTHLVDP